MTKKTETENTQTQSEMVIATFDINTLSGAMKLSNADTQGGISLKNLDAGSRLKITDIAVKRDVTEEYGKPQEVKVTYLFGEDGLMYSSISDTVSMGAKSIAQLMINHKVQEVMVLVEKKKNKSGDNEYITIGVDEVK